MTRARVRAAAVFIGVLTAALVALAVVGRGPGSTPRREPNARPSLLLLTSLPLVFGEQFSLQNGGSAALDALNTRYRVLPISVTNRGELAKARLLLMAQPAAQPAEDLVELDRWVRAGGRVLLLADPMLEWPSERPLGDPLRSAPMFADTGLLAHWGLRLDAPDARGTAERQLGGFKIMTDSSGLLSGTCEVSADKLVARCRVGKGKATIVADADFLDADRLGKSARHNLDGLLGELAALEQP